MRAGNITPQNGNHTGCCESFQTGNGNVRGGCVGSIVATHGEFASGHRFWNEEESLVEWFNAVVGGRCLSMLAEQCACRRAKRLVKCGAATDAIRIHNEESTRTAQLNRRSFFAWYKAAAMPRVTNRPINVPSGHRSGPRCSACYAPWVCQGGAWGGEPQAMVHV